MAQFLQRLQKWMARPHSQLHYRNIRFASELSVPHLFMDVLPIETVLRIWDCLFFEGDKILLRVAFSLIVVNKQKFLGKDNFTDIYAVFKEITQDETALNCHKFLKLCFTLPKTFSRAQIRKLRLKAAAGINSS